ncbi:hypothetical protein HOO65_050407 [Ceratocystis lukuohia]|uniref:Type I restriction enzyme R protein N-terminal domain-containing protein n=1 Tax=Ceratocystis lukuohia TaxID=2019550 RepID=A0ABR4MGA6_9PEZI
MSLLKTHQGQSLMQDANDYPEWATTRFWEYVFKQVAFVGPDWIIASQQPPTRRHDDRRRVDLKLELINQFFHQPLLFIEAKRSDESLTYFDDVEAQAYNACMAHLVETGQKTVWAMTCVGTKTRLWAVYHKNDYMKAFWPPGNGLSDPEEYADYEFQEHEILYYLDYMKNNIVPDGKIFRQIGHERPAEVPFYDVSGAHYVSVSSCRNDICSCEVQNMPDYLLNVNIDDWIDCETCISEDRVRVYLYTDENNTSFFTMSILDPEE